MRVRLLGTGASDGWPDPWCSCASCAAAREQGVLRGQTGVLVDDRLLLDLGPELPRAALRQGTSLAAVEAVLVTHVHEDHFAPAALMWRSWQPDPAPLQVVGPPAVVRAAAPRAGAGVALREVRAGDRLQVAGYEVAALPARHGDDAVGPAVLYDVQGPDGTRLLYGTDTGVLPEEAVRLAAGRAYDLVLLELSTMDLPTHLDLTTWPRQVERLRAAGAVTARTRVLAVHLGHGNPPPDVLDALLASWGASAGRDGQVLDLGRPAGPKVLVLGGARSGKSAYAEDRAAALAGAAPVTYVATAPDRAGDADWAERVAAHRARRPSAWVTLETGDVAAVLRQADGPAAGGAPVPTDGPVLVDDLGLWLTRQLDGNGGDGDGDADGDGDGDGGGDGHGDAARAAAWEGTGTPAGRSALARVERAADDLVDAWRRAARPVLLVAPEVGSGVVPATRSGRLFRDLLGGLTRRLAADADEVVQVVAGVPRRLR